MRIPRLWVMVVLGLVPLLAQAKLVNAMPSMAPHITVVDDWQRPVQFLRKPQRIVSLSAHLTELLFDAGLGDQLVAVDLHSDFPPQVKNLPRINAWPEPSLEALLKLKPDVVLMWGQGLKRATVERLEQFGIRVWVSDPTTVANIPTTIERLAQLGSDTKSNDAKSSDAKSAAERVRALKATLALSQTRTNGQAVPVFMQVWQQPLMTVGGDTVVADALRHCGAHAVLSTAIKGSAVVSLEAVLKASPLAIVSSNEHDVRAYWKARLSVEQSGALEHIIIEPQTLSRPSARLIDALIPLCRKIDALRKN